MISARTGSFQSLFPPLLLVVILLTYTLLLVTSVPQVALVGAIALCILVAAMIRIELALALLVVAMLLSPEIFLGSVGLRQVTLRVEDVLIPLIGLVWLGRTAASSERRLWTPSPINVPILAVIALNLISSTRAVMTGVSLGKTFFVNMKFIEFFAIYFFAGACFDSKRQAKTVVGLLFLTGLVVVLYALPMIPKTEIYTENRLSAPFEGQPEPGTLGGYLCLLLALLFGFFIHLEKREQRVGVGIAIAVIIVVILFTLSRTSYGTLFATLLVVSILGKRPWMFGGLLLVLCLSPILLPEKVFERIVTTFDPSRPWGIEDAARERLEVWDKAFFLLRYRPFIGMGVGALDVVDSQYARLLIETGILGLGFFLWLHWKIFRFMLAFYRRTQDTFFKALCFGYLCGQMALLIHAAGAITFCIVRIMEPFWFLTGLLVAMERLDRDSEEGVVPA